MKTLTSFTLAFLIFAISQFAFSQETSPCGCQLNERSCLIECFQNNASIRSPFWQKLRERPPHERLETAKPEVIEGLQALLLVNGAKEKITSVQPDKEFLADVKEALKSLPATVTQAINEKLAGVVFVNGLGSTGITQSIYGPFNDADGAFVVLSVELLQQKANDWFTFKESSPFQIGNGFHLRGIIENTETNTRAAAIQYILTHELGHVIARGENYHPPAGIPASEVIDSDYPFFQISWLTDKLGGTYESRAEETLTERLKVKYYAKQPLLNVNDAVKIYRQLDATNFPTLYSTLNYWEDFADSFVSYVHVELLKKPWQISLEKNGQSVMQYSSCWQKTRCAEKKKFFDSLFKK